jgi:hypothetical protein
MVRAVAVIGWTLAALLALAARVGADGGPGPTISLFPGGTAAETITAPSAYAGSSGIYYVGAFAIRQIILGAHGRRTGVWDGALTGGTAFGEPGHGVLFSATMADVDQLNNIYFSARWQLCPETVRSPAVAIGMEDILDNVAPRQAVGSPYAVVSRTFWNARRMLEGNSLFARTTLSLGYGGGRFRRQPFEALATSLSDCSQAIVEHDRYGFNVGLSAAPWRREPGLVVGVYDMRLDNASYHTFAGSVTYAWWRH